MENLFSILQQEWAIRALLASSMVGLMCGMLGCFIVLRNMALIGDALAHAILPGVVVAFVVVGYSTIGFFAGSVVAGLLSAAGITWIQHHVKTKNDAAIGIVFTSMFALGVIGISSVSREGVHLDLKDFLFGNVLGVSNEDLYLTAGVTIYVIVSIIVFYRYLFATTFQEVVAQTMGISVKMIHYFLMLMLSFAVVASLGTVGVILVVAMLITPASTALLLSNRLQNVLAIAAVIGLLSAVMGLVLSILFEAPPGPSMAVVATFFYILAVFFSPKKGLIFSYFQKKKLQRKIQIEDILKEGLKLQNKGNLSFPKLREKLGYSKSLLKKLLTQLSYKNFLKYENNKITLSQKGKDEALRLVRAHRLWETYLVNQIGLSAEQIHEDAEKYEHLLSEDLLDEVDATLGFPREDPHGSPIPSKVGFPEFSLNNMQINQFASIANQQISETISTQLWKLGLLPESKFKVERKDKELIYIVVKGKEVIIPKILAKRVSVNGVIS
jgi:ABC-type Mn2+/Zn2+ transport system permease subunit/Mn-dependent DtxR family transcriptional regulator